MKPTFEGTISILVKAYLNDELSHNTCGKCAVGNIVEHSYGRFEAAMPYLNGFGGFGWSNVFCTESASRKQRIFPDHYCNEAKRQIDATGYTWQELAKVENAFELNNKSMFDGLMAVVDVLAEIHGVDLSVKESAKLQFIKS
jgi:hypothetical protein